MRKGLVGYTGFVGSNCDLTSYNDLINSKNIKDYRNEQFDLLVVAAGDARKWFANSNPKLDVKNLSGLFFDLIKIKTKKIIYFSSIDIYGNNSVNENDFEIKNHPYGINRFWMENLIKNHFDDVSIIRLGGLFGKNLKKNLIFDGINKRLDQIENYNLESTFQFFNLNHIELLIEEIILKKIPIINAVSEPITTKEILNTIDLDFSELNFSSNKVSYNIKTLYRKTGYLYNKKEILQNLRNFFNDYR